MRALKPRPPSQALVMSYVDRLGREQIETTSLLTQIVVAGVRVFDYLEDRERVLDSPTEDFLGWCEDGLPPFAMPRYVVVPAELPKTPSNKVQKYRLRETVRPGGPGRPSTARAARA